MVIRALARVRLSFADHVSLSRTLAFAFGVFPIFWATSHFTSTPLWGLVSCAGSTWFLLPKYEGESLDLIVFVLVVPGLLALVQLTQLWGSLLTETEKLKRWLALLPAWALAFEIGTACTQGTLADAFDALETTPISFSGWALAVFVGLGAFRAPSTRKVVCEQAPAASPSYKRRQRPALFAEALLSGSYLILSYLLPWCWELLDPLDPANILGYFFRACSVTALLTLCFGFLREGVRGWLTQSCRTESRGFRVSLLDPVLLWGSLLLGCKSRYKEAASLLGSAFLLWLQLLSDFLQTTPWGCGIYFFVLAALLRFSCGNELAASRLRVAVKALVVAALPWLILLAVARPLIAAGKADAIFHRWQCSFGPADSKNTIVPMWNVCNSHQDQPRNGGRDFLRFSRKPSWLLWPIGGSETTSYCLAKLEEKTLYVMLPPGRCEWRRVPVVSLLGTSWKMHLEGGELSLGGGRGLGSCLVEVLEKQRVDAPPLTPYPLVRRRVIEVVGLTTEKEPWLVIQAPSFSGRSRNLLVRLE